MMQVEEMRRYEDGGKWALRRGATDESKKKNIQVQS